MQIILNACEADDTYYSSQFYMETFLMMRLHEVDIYIISVSINRMLISQLTRFLDVKFMFPPLLDI